MVFPVVESRSSQAGGVSTIVPITMPSIGLGGNGLLVVSFSANMQVADQIYISSGTGWNELGQVGGPGGLTHVVYWKIANGSDALTLDLTAATRWSYIVHRVSGAESVTASAGGSSSGANSNPPAHTPPSGSDTYLWLVYRSAIGNASYTSFSANYGSVQNVDGALASQTNMQSGERNLEAASEDPGPFVSSSAPWSVWTLAVKPTPPPDDSVPVISSLANFDMESGIEDIFWVSTTSERTSVNWSISGGPDQQHFEPFLGDLNYSDTLQWRPHSYEYPTDANKDNVYQCTLRLSRNHNAAIYAEQTLTVTVTPKSFPAPRTLDTSLYRNSVRFTGSQLSWMAPNARNVFNNDFFGVFESESGTSFKIWNGSAFEFKPVKVRISNAWVLKPLKRWTGADWL